MTRRTRKVIPGLKVTKAFYPDDLSSPSHSYMLSMHTQNATLRSAIPSHINQVEVS